MNIQRIGLFGRGLGVASVVGLLLVTAPVAHGKQATIPLPHQELRGWSLNGGPEIGVSVRDVTGDDGARSSGAVVENVRGDSPAARAGIQAGDLITNYDGESVRSARQLARLIDETPGNRQVALTVTRAGRRVEISVTPQTRNPWSAALTHPAPFPSENLNLHIQPRADRVTPGLYLPAVGGRLGVQTLDLTPQLGEYFGAADGVLITSVGDDTPARAAGLKAGDVITKIDGQTIADTSTFRQQLAETAGRVTLTVVRDRAERAVTVDLQSGRQRSAAPQRYQR